MNSPVLDRVKQLIQVDKSATQPVYVQISQQIINAIQRGYITKGTKLPGTRVFSKALNIHRNTAVAVYNELAAQGWVEILANKGSFVLVPERKKEAIVAHAFQVDQINRYPDKTGFPFQASFHLASTREYSEAKISINDGQPDLRLHPTHQFSRWYNSTLKRRNLPSKWHQNEDSFYFNYETQLCNFLNATRGFNMKPQNLISTRSTEMSLYVVSQLLLKKRDVVLVGDLSNYSANRIFQQVGADVKIIPVDQDGLDVNYIKTHFIKKSIRCVYLNPQRHYPSNQTLSAERRLQLLELAKEYQFAIIEDDFDYDFQYEGSPLLPLASSDTHGMVIYLGKFGQSLFPSFQTGFVVAPKNLISEAKNYLELLDAQGDMIQQQMLSALIYEGEIHRYLKKNVLLYKQRLEVLCNQLDFHFGDILRWEKPTGGLAIWLQFTEPISLVRFSEESVKENVFLPKTILYQDKHTCAIRFGFGHLNETEIEYVIDSLKSAYLRIAKSH